MKTRTTLLLILLATTAAIAQRRPADNGLSLGAYAHHIRIAQDRNDGYYDTSLSKSLFRFSPGGGIHAGVLFQLASDRCWLDLRLRADYAPKIRSQYDIDDYTTGNIGFDRMLLPGINIGLLYRF